MGSIFCKECNKSFEIEKSLHFHLKAHNLDVPTYYQRHYPRYDWWDGTLIKFKDKDHYFSENFNSRANLISWLTQKAAPEEARIYSIELLKQRKEEKGLIYAPDHVYLKSLMIPSVDYYEKYQDGYNRVCESIGLKSQYDYTTKITVETAKKQEMIIHYDSRERDPLLFTVKTVKNTLNFADYSVGGELFDNIWVERKELGDLISSFSNGYERIQREIERAKEQCAYLIFACERPLKEALAIEHLPFLHMQCTSSFIFSRIRRILEKYINVQFCFCNGRGHLSNLIESIFLIGKNIKKIDIQHKIDNRQL